MNQRTWSQTYHCQTRNQEILIRLMTANTENLEARDAINIKSVRNE